MYIWMDDGMFFSSSFKGKPNDLFHSGKEIRNIIRGQIQLKDHILQFLILRGSLPAGIDHNPVCTADDCAVIEEIRRDKKTDMMMRNCYLVMFQQDWIIRFFDAFVR